MAEWMSTWRYCNILGGRLNAFEIRQRGARGRWVGAWHGREDFTGQRGAALSGAACVKPLGHECTSIGYSRVAHMSS